MKLLPLGRMAQWEEQRWTGQSGRSELKAPLRQELAVGELEKVALPLQTSAFNSKMKIPTYQVSMQMQQENTDVMQSIACGTGEQATNSHETTHNRDLTNILLFIYKRNGTVLSILP